MARGRNAGPIGPTLKVPKLLSVIGRRENVDKPDHTAPRDESTPLASVPVNRTSHPHTVHPLPHPQEPPLRLRDSEVTGASMLKD